jgi:hypothetical protein
VIILKILKVNNKNLKTNLGSGVLK